jgi:hypothetical protein
MTNPITQSTSPPSFTVTTYTSDTLQYSIDTLTGGLIVQFACDYPCQTCLSTSRTTCLSCQSFVEGNTLKYLYNQKCISECPVNTTSTLAGVETYICKKITVDFQVSVDSITTTLAGYEPSGYSLIIDPIKQIPQSSTLRIGFPEEVALAEGFTNISCTVLFADGKTLTYTAQPV